MSTRVGVVLSGCGVFDGSEIHEAVSILIALDRRGAQAICMAPNIPQAMVVNHLTGKAEVEERRYVLEEAARIARGRIRDLAVVHERDVDGLVFPGGYGAVKNLCSFAGEGVDCLVNPDVERLIREVHAAGKPIGLACIAPVVAAKVLGAIGAAPRLTIGTDRGTADAIEAMGGQHEAAGEISLCIDEKNRLVSTPCYMNNVTPWIVYQGADKMVDALLKMASQPARPRETVIA
jgi:enhancing lycopene biosynthesis protein 2